MMNYRALYVIYGDKRTGEELIQNGVEDTWNGLAGALEEVVWLLGWNWAGVGNGDADVIRLGKAADPKITGDGATLACGADQFKVNFQKLHEVFGQNVRSGVREAADQTIRRQIETFASFIFASNAAQREFWLGLRQLSPTQIRSLCDGLKPCLHGSDAHKFSLVHESR